MKRCIALILCLVLAACQPLPSTPDVKKLDVVLLGTYGYTTYEVMGRTIEDYDAELEYDNTKLPDTQTGFPLVLPIAFYNQGKQSWYDARAKLNVIITAPDGEEISFPIDFKNAEVKRGRPKVGGFNLIQDSATPEERRLRAGDRRVLYFKIDYKPTMPGVYSIMLELESQGITGTRLSRSAFTINVVKAISYITTSPTICSMEVSCSVSEVCCSKGIDVPEDERIGHCAPVCDANEIEIAYKIISRQESYQ